MLLQLCNIVSYNVAMLLLGVLSIFNILLVLVEAEKEILILKKHQTAPSYSMSRNAFNLNLLRSTQMYHFDFTASPGWTCIVCWKRESWPSTRMLGTTPQRTMKSLPLTLVTAHLILQWDTRRRKMSSFFSKSFSIVAYLNGRNCDLKLWFYWV